MKFTVTMTDPDALNDGIEDAVHAKLKAPGLTPAEQRAIEGIRSAAAHEIYARWFAHGRYLSVEIDTDAQTIRVWDAPNWGEKS